MEKGREKLCGNRWTRNHVWLNLGSQTRRQRHGSLEPCKVACDHDEHFRFAELSRSRLGCELTRDLRSVLPVLSCPRECRRRKVNDVLVHARVDLVVVVAEQNQTDRVNTSAHHAKLLREYASGAE